MGVYYNRDMKTLEQRINNVIGQLEGAKKMLADERRDCFALLTQLKAAKSGLSALMEKLVGKELDHCLLGSRQYSKEKMERIFKEIIKNK
jgi:DNA-binding FrmR family transcriptional regulator